MSTPERRQSPRTTLERLAYIHIEPNNGGIVLNVSPDGLCFHSIAAVEKNGPLRFSLLEQNRRIAACGELTWTDEIQEVAGVCFTTLTAEARKQIEDWISQPTAPLEEHTSTLGSALLKAFPKFRVRRSDAAPESATPSLFATGFQKIRTRIKLSGFAKGLATGLFISALSASLFLLYAQRREIGLSLIHLGERLAGERLVAEQSTGDLVLAKPEAKKRPALLEPQAVDRASEGASPVHTQTPLDATSPASAHSPAAAPTQERHKIPAPSQAEVRAHVPAQPDKFFAHSVASPMKPQPVRLTPQLSAHGASPAANDPSVQPPVVRNSSETAAPPTTTASLGAPSSPAPNMAPLLATPSQPEPTDTVQLRGISEASAISLPQMFFELGKFKDALRARDLGDRVEQLGLHPSVVQKGHLWMSAFYVLVGPYSDPEEASRTHKNLLSHGYEPRPFERGSRNFTFISGLTLAGMKLPVGDFTINWESYVSDAKVNFAQGNDVLATASGQWVKRPARYQRDEYVYFKTSNGLRLLREIHFSGLDRALVFRDSS
jgi:PilZ domain